MLPGNGRGACPAVLVGCLLASHAVARFFLVAFSFGARSAAARAFWEEESDYTPESRVEVHLKQAEMQREKDMKVGGSRADKKPAKSARHLFRPDGSPYNVNEGGWDFVLEGQEATAPVRCSHGEAKEG